MYHSYTEILNQQLHPSALVVAAAAADVTPVITAV